MLIIICIAAFIITLLGGLFALKFRDRLHLVLGFSAGAVLGVAFFDLIPESIELGEAFYEPSTILAITAFGFLLYMLLDRFVIGHHHHADIEHVHQENNDICETEKRGILGASSFSIHSFLDGFAIGLAFQVNAAVGIVVTIAVLVHDFSDGLNTVSVVLKNNGDKKRAMMWLLVDAIAPIIGIICASFITLPEMYLAPVLAAFAGFFLYIGASDLLPESHHAHPTLWTTFCTVLGASVLFFAIRLAGL